MIAGYTPYLLLSVPQVVPSRNYAMRLLRAAQT